MTWLVRRNYLGCVLQAQHAEDPLIVHESKHKKITDTNDDDVLNLQEDCIEKHTSRRCIS